jgi:hypothetical protein
LANATFFDSVNDAGPSSTSTGPDFVVTTRCRPQAPRPGPGTFFTLSIVPVNVVSVAGS